MGHLADGNGTWRGQYRKSRPRVCENLAGASMADTGSFRLPVAPRDLLWWSSRDWAHGVELTALAGLEQFAVRTRNSRYEITVLSPATGEVLVRGGRFFPEHTRAHLAGCSMGGNFLKVRAIHPGFLLEFIHDGRRIVTTRVREIVTVAPPSI
jgi:hypothetical protein